MTGRIHDRLVEHFGDSAIFRDVDDIPLGVDFAKYIDEKVGQCEVLLAVVGRDWLKVTDEEGNRRLELPGDYVRLELESALKRDIPVVPLLVRRASMPEADELPDSIRGFSTRNGLQIRADPDFRTDCDRLIEGLQRDMTGRRPLVSPHPEPVVKETNWKRKALVIGGLGVVLVFALLGFYAWNSGGQASNPGILAFQASPVRIVQGSNTTLRWKTKYAEAVEILPGIGTVAATGARVVTPKQDTTYTLVARGSARKTVKRTVSVEVIPSRPVAAIPISRLSVAQSSIILGKSTTLSWQTKNATQVEIQPGIGRVDPSGSMKISPRRDTTYTLTAKSSAGTATSSAIVKVKGSLLINRGNTTLQVK